MPALKALMHTICTYTHARIHLHKTHARRYIHICMYTYIENYIPSIKHAFHYSTYINTCVFLCDISIHVICRDIPIYLTGTLCSNISYISMCSFFTAKRLTRTQIIWTTRVITISYYLTKDSNHLTTAT